jgi:S-adenosyl methyltransferase
VAAALVAGVLAAPPPGSYLALYHQASDLHPAMTVAARRWNRQSARPVTLRSADEIGGFAKGLDPVPPGLVPVCDWRPDLNGPADPRFEDVVPLYGLVARKPSSG